jgi:hypothetical protein
MIVGGILREASKDSSMAAQKIALQDPDDIYA